MKVRLSRFLLLFWLLMAPASVVSMHARRSVSQSNSTVMAPNVTLHLRPMVLYSDMDVWDEMKNPEFKASDAGWGGMGEISYSHPIYRNLLVRANLGGGYFKGDATARKNENKGKYKSYFGELGAGIEYVPFRNAGFYTFFGVGFYVGNFSINKYDPIINQTSPNATVTTQFLPFFPIELGYKFSVARTFDLGLALFTHIGMMDFDKVSMDGYGDYQESHFSDGYIGLSVDLAFHTGKASRYSKSKYHRNSRKCHCYPW